MRTKIFILALALALSFGMSDSPAQAAFTPTYLGQTIWTMNITTIPSTKYRLAHSVTLTGRAYQSW